jgi:ABC-type transport system substrate-binding protein
VNVLKNTNTSTFNKAFSAYLTSTTATRDSTAQAVQTIAVDEGLSLPVSQVKSIWISSPKLKGFELGSGGSSNNIDEWSK